MFTGIVQRCVTINSIDIDNQITTISFLGVANWNLAVGDSLLINGICSTITGISGDACTVQYMPQTIRLTTVADWKPQQICNAETSLTLSSPLSGWLVTGHIDAVGTITALQAVATDTQLIISFPEEFAHLVVQQGAITIDGINLTISSVKHNSFSVHIIPYTLEHTTLHSIKPGDSVNLEFDYFAKLTAQQLQQSQKLR